MNTITLPKSWCQRRLGDCGRWISGGTPPKSDPLFWNGDIPWFSAKSLKTFDLVDSEDRVTRLGAESGTSLVPKGTILFVVRGMSLANEFRVGVTSREATLNQDLRGIIPSEDVDSRYLARYLRQSADVMGKVDNASHGTKRIESDRLKAITIPLPPLPEQHRIAEILDKADSIRSKRGTVSSTLLEFPRRLFFEMFGNVVVNDRRWKQVVVADAGQVQLGRQRSPKYQTGKFTRPYVRVANVFDDRIDLDDVLSMDFGERDFATYRLESGDILLNEGQSTELVGRPAMWRDELPNCCFQNTLIRFRAKLDVTNPEFALAVFREYLHRGAFARVSSKTSNVAHLGAARFAVMPFPLPPREEQDQFAAVREKLRDTAATAQRAYKESDGLFDSLVDRAFRGAL